MLPIIAAGNFGLHIVNNPVGTWSFVGNVPALSPVVSKTFVVALRNDIFVKYLGR